MVLLHRYWGELIGGTDDSLTLLEYLAQKGKEEISAEEIFSDFGLDRLEGQFRQPQLPLVYTDEQGWETPIDCAVDLIADLAALLLECKAAGRLDLAQLSGEEGAPERLVRIAAGPEQTRLICRALEDFAQAPLEYDLSQLCPEEDLLELARLCREIGRQLAE